MPDRPHVCILTSAHPADDVRVHSRMASAFLDAGYRVTWVGPSNSYFRRDDDRDAEITYRLFEPNTSKRRRLTATRRALREARHVEGVDWWYSPDPDAATLSCRVARRQGGRVLFDIHEVFHGALLDRWFPVQPTNAVREVVRRRIARTCRRADLVVGVSSAVLQPYVSGDTRSMVVRNCAPRWFAGEETSVPVGDRVRVMHGKALPTNGAAQVAEAVSLLPPEQAQALEVYMGEPGGGPSAFSERLVADVATRANASTLTMNKGVPHEQMPALLASCAVGMVAYGRDLGVDSLPNRLFEYMASGLAILAPEYAVEIRKIVEREQIGRMVDFESPRAIADGLVWMLEHPAEVAEMGKRARVAFLERYNWDVESGRMVEAMREIETAGR